MLGWTCSGLGWVTSVTSLLCVFMGSVTLNGADTASFIVTLLMILFILAWSYSSCCRLPAFKLNRWVRIMREGFRFSTHFSKVSPYRQAPIPSSSCLWVCDLCESAQPWKMCRCWSWSKSSPQSPMFCVFLFLSQQHQHFASPSCVTSTDSEPQRFVVCFQARGASSTCVSKCFSWSTHCYTNFCVRSCEFFLSFLCVCRRI